MNHVKDRSASIFGNVIPSSVVRAGEKKKASYAKKFAHDKNARYSFLAAENAVLTSTLGVRVLQLNEHAQNVCEDKNDVENTKIDVEKGVIVGNIRMGFGHYRIAMAIASAAKAAGLKPYWFDLVSFPNTTASKVISHLNGLYSLGSRLSQRSSLFNKFYWEPLNYEGFKKLSFNAQDQKVSELFATVCKGLPQNMPFFGTHVWPAQAAVHAGMKNVVNIVPDNWPMALHLAEGSLHLVQSQSAYMGYRMLREMDKSRFTLKPIPASEIAYVGHFVDHEIVSNISADCERRLERLRLGKARRVLLSVGGAGAQQDYFVSMLKKILPLAESGKIVLFLNFGDHRKMWDEMIAAVPSLKRLATCHFDRWSATSDFATNAIDGEVSGVHAFCDSDIFAAVYLSNILMRASDLLVTKPSELSYYPVPKLFIKRVGGHEMWGAIRGAELGDGTIQCENVDFAVQALELLVNESDLLCLQIQSILNLNSIGAYNGAYEAVRRAMERKNE